MLKCKTRFVDWRISFNLKRNWKLKKTFLILMMWGMLTFWQQIISYLFKRWSISSCLSIWWCISSNRHTSFSWANLLCICYMQFLCQWSSLIWEILKGSQNGSIGFVYSFKFCSRSQSISTFTTMGSQITSQTYGMFLIKLDS